MELVQFNQSALNELFNLAKSRVDPLHAVSGNMASCFNEINELVREGYSLTLDGPLPLIGPNCVFYLRKPDSLLNTLHRAACEGIEEQYRNDLEMTNQIIMEEEARARIEAKRRAEAAVQQTKLDAQLEKQFQAELARIQKEVAV